MCFYQNLNVCVLPAKLASVTKRMIVSEQTEEHGNVSTEPVFQKLERQGVDVHGKQQIVLCVFIPV